MTLTQDNLRIVFAPTATTFNFYNAYYLAKLSNLVYQPLDKIEGTLKSQYGLTQFKSFDVGETQAFLAANKDIVVLVIRGTTSWKDWLTNVRFVLTPSAVGKVHLGFHQALDLVWEGIYETLCTWKDRDQTLWVTGHSLGGALATLAVDRLTEKLMDVSGLYTFGQPRVGDRKFADNFDRNMKRYSFRFVDDQDIVTKVPFPPYKHVGNEYFFDRQGKLHTQRIWGAWFASASESVYLRSVEDGSKYALQNPGGIRDHNAEYYCKYLHQNLPAEVKNSFVEYINEV
ncbi:MAG: lipase family protein [Candidatus Omnitrophica bacterium]|nr:lipase family protein [Candidatus Omnitrophota bacterium]